MANKTRIQTDGAPRSTGTHSQAVRANGFVFVTGYTGRDPASGELADGLAAQTQRMLDNVEAVLAAAGCTQHDIVKVTLVLADIADFRAVDDIYAEWMPDRDATPLPARTAMAAAALPAGALVLMDVVAVSPDA